MKCTLYIFICIGGQYGKDAHENDTQPCIDIKQRHIKYSDNQVEVRAKFAHIKG